MFDYIAWGSSGGTTTGFGDDGSVGFGGDAFDSFIPEPTPAPQSTPAKIKKEHGEEDDEKEQDLSIFIRYNYINTLFVFFFYQIPHRIE